MENTYKVVMTSENRKTNERYTDKVLNVTVSQHDFNRTNATQKIHDILKKQYDTKSRRYLGFEWVVSSVELK
jgi:3-dehydroquinate dehydratase